MASMLAINADDWGRSPAETDAALSCYRRGRITSVSAMVFMEDSERAARLAGDWDIAEVGLHLNLTQEFTGTVVPGRLGKCHHRIARFLRSNKYALIFYNPTLRSDFLQDFTAQLEEFRRLYGREPSHFDGHQHMHLCTNMLLNATIPPGAKVRRNFSFLPQEKHLLNRSYRRIVDMWLARRYRLTDFFFALSDNRAPERLTYLGALASNSEVELMTHPVIPDEFECLMNDGPLAVTGFVGRVQKL